MYRLILVYLEYNYREYNYLTKGFFEPYNRAKASILYFIDIKKIRTNKHYWFFTVKNDGYSLDKKRKPVDGINDLELVLSEKSLDQQNETYLLQLWASLKAQ